MISPMTQTRCDFLSALSGAILVYVAPSPESQPDYITYWLFEFDEAMDGGNFCDARLAAAELKTAIERRHVPLQWRAAHGILTELLRP